MQPTQPASALGPAPATLTVREARRRIGDQNISACSLYDAVNRGKLPSVRFGTRILILRGPFEALLATGELRPNTKP
jgi:hypothetical protein